MPVFENKPLVTECHQHLVGVTAAKGIFQHFPGFRHDLLNGKFISAVVGIQMGDDKHQITLSVRRTRPPSGKEVRIKLLLNLGNRDARISSLIQTLDKGVIHFFADELDEIGIAARHLDNRFDGLRA